MVKKIAKISPVHPEIFDYWTDLHQNFTRYSGISGTIKSCIYTALCHSISECQSDESAEFAILSQNCCYGNVPWDIGNRGPDWSSAPKTLSFREKIAKISPADPEIIVLREIIKKEEEEKKKEIMEGIIYSPVGNLAERAK